MDFGNFGTVSFTNQSKAVPFIEYLAQGKFMATECTQCGEKFFPPRLDCPNCLDSDITWFEIKSKGKLVTYTTVNYGPLGFEDDAPYTLGIVEFEEGVKVLSRISKEIDTNDIKIGMQLKVVPISLGNGKVSYEFQL